MYQYIPPFKTQETVWEKLKGVEPDRNITCTEEMGEEETNPPHEVHGSVGHSYK